MNRYLIGVLLLAGLAQSSGCCWVCKTKPLEDVLTPLGRLAHDAVPDLIYLAESRRTTCPKIAPLATGEWLVRPLLTLPAASPSSDGESGSVLYCQYIWKAKDGHSPDLTVLTKQGLVVRLDPPVIAVTPAVSGLPELRDYSREACMTRARLDIPQVKLKPPSPQRKGSGVRVAVLDSVAQKPSGELQDPSGHGLAVMRVIEELACGDDPSCAVELRPYHALPFVIDEDWLKSTGTGAGAVGTLGTLAPQIKLATDQWVADTHGHSSPPLIINMSLGWSGCYQADAIEVNLVRHAIEYATCHGALVVVSGGNRDAIADCPSAPAAPGKPLHMLPGRWVQEQVTEERCRVLTGEHFRGRGDALETHERGDGSRPLLLAIGAVDRHDEQLSITDHESLLTAYGQSVTLSLPSAAAKFMQMSGTSMTAAAASGMAARVLRYRPDLDARQLTSLLYKRSVPLGREPSPAGLPCREGEACKSEVGRLSLCALLADPDVANADCTPLAAHATTQCGTPAQVKSASTGTATPCVKDCWSPGAGNFDIPDKPWIVTQPPSGRGGGHIRNKTNSPAVHGALRTAQRAPSHAAQVTASSAEYTLYAGFDVDVRDIVLVVLPEVVRPDQPAGELRYQLGSASANTIMQWDIAGAQARTARLEFRLPDDDIDLCDVPVEPDHASVNPPPPPNMP